MEIRKYTFLILALLLLNLVNNNVFAQKQKIINLQNYDKQPYHFGFIIGSGVSLFRSNSDSLNSGREIKTSGPNFNVGIVGNLRLADHFDLRFIPALSMSSGRSIVKVDSLQIGDNVEYDKEDYHDFRTILLVLPLELKIRSNRYNNMAAYVLTGMAYTYDFSNKSKEEAKFRLPKSDFLPEIGVGMDFYTEWFKFGVEAKMAYGLTNLNKTPDKDLGPVAPADFRSKLFFLTFTFE